jgi:hypothetical protein
MGFTIRELADIMKARARGGAPCARVRELAAAKLRELDTRLEEMAQLRDSLARTLRDWDCRLAATPHGGRALLLDSLTQAGQPHTPAKPVIRGTITNTRRRGHQ